jgi:pimeloyl-ACP methyl ester carboxylesterase
MTRTEDSAAEGAASGLGVQSRWIDLDGPVHYLDFGGPAHGPTVVCVHGLTGSAVNWSAIAPLLTGRCRLLAPDLAGHGLTRSAGRGTGVASNRMLLHRFIESVAAGPVILMGNSMGGMISLLEASAAPLAVAGLILVDPALPFVPARPDPLVSAMFVLCATPGLGRVILGRFHRMSPEAAVAGVLSLCCADVSRVPAGVVAQHVEVARRRATFTNLGRDISVAMRSVIATAGLSDGQAYRRGIRSISCPVLLLHGERDRLVPVTAALAAARANPAWSLVVLPGVGHVPQLEAPRECAKAITEWLETAGRGAAESATAPRRPGLPERLVRRRPGCRWHVRGPRRSA